MTELESEVASLKQRLATLEERVRIDAVAEAFLQGNHAVREGDYFLLGSMPTKLSSVSSEGKWTYFDGRNCIEPFCIPDPGEYERLYTNAEVAEIVSKSGRR